MHIPICGASKTLVGFSLAGHLTICTIFPGGGFASRISVRQAEKYILKAGLLDGSGATAAPRSYDMADVTVELDNLDLAGDDKVVPFQVEGLTCAVAPYRSGRC